MVTAAVADSKKTCPNKVLKMELHKRIRKAWTRAVPLVSLSTVDAAQSMDAIASEAEEAILLSYDCAFGVTVPAQKRVKEAESVAKKFGECFTMFEFVQKACQQARRTATNGEGELMDAILFVHNAHRFLNEAADIQMIWNARDILKSQRVMLVLMGPRIVLPVELQHDVIEFDEPLPTVEVLSQRINQTVSAFESVAVSEETLGEAANASVGLSSFAAEQLAAMNTSKTGLSARGIWVDKCRKISETPGLKVLDGTGSFDDIAGLESIKEFLKMILNGSDAPNAIVFVDEFEKALGGAAGDNTGVAQDQVGVLLQYMQDSNADGCILLGVPGAAKSEIAKKAGAEAGIPTIQLDLGAMKGKHVGESEQRIRDALKVVDRVSGGKTLWLATSNNISILPPELQRRFKLGVWFFDLPNAYERSEIWKMYVEKNGINEVVSSGLMAREWTGAEIRTCCEIARKAGISLEDASVYISPVSVTGRDQLESLRTKADGRYLSATNKGVYVASGSPEVKPAKNSRRVAAV